MMNKKADFNFEWIFAIVAGGMILILAVYGATKIGENKRYEGDTEIAKRIAILTDPLQAGFADGSFGKITFRQETKMSNECFTEGFGKNEISVSTRSGVGEEWLKEGGEVSIHNKYIFSEEEGGEEFYVFSKSFKFPFKVSDLIFITSKQYCFVEPPLSLEDELEGFNAPNIRVDNCSQGDTRVCFGERCEISVYPTCTGCGYDVGYVSKGSDRIPFAGSLIYAAVFSDKQVYDCNVKRLLYRASFLSLVFADKISLMQGRGVNSNLRADLLSFSQIANSSDIDDLISLNDVAGQLERRNVEEGGRLW